MQMQAPGQRLVLVVGADLGTNLPQHCGSLIGMLAYHQEAVQLVAAAVVGWRLSRGFQALILVHAAWHQR